MGRVNGREMKPVQDRKGEWTRDEKAAQEKKGADGREQRPSHSSTLRSTIYFSRAMSRNNKTICSLILNPNDPYNISVQSDRRTSPVHIPKG